MAILKESFIYIFYFLIFPGFLFSITIGLLSSWIDRKVTARVQYRKGPPMLQPFYDIIKLWGKETTIPANGNPSVFLIAPIIGLIGVTIVSTILWYSNIFQHSFIGDLIVIIYLLTLPSLAIIIGGSASGNPLASVGVSREIKLLLGYELPFILSIVTVVLKAGGSIKLTEISNTAVNPTVSGIISLVVVMLCIQAKLGFTPFDIAEAETEIMSGVFIEYSGPPLSIFKMTQSLMLFTLPVFVITIFLGGLNFQGINILWSILKYVVILVVIIVIKNTNPRVRIDQAVKFFWRFCGTFSLIALILAIISNLYNISWL